VARKIRVVHFGVGPIGAGIVRLAARKPGLEIVGAIDLANVGNDLGEVAGVGRRLQVPIGGDAAEVLRRTRPDVVLHATGSEVEKIFPQLEAVIRSGARVVSTCEELSYPFRTHPEPAAAIDRLAREHEVAVVGTGVNPGFLMDTWPLAMTAVCQEVSAVRVERVQDASLRRFPFQKKIGAGRTLDEFQRLAAAGAIRHVGLAESIAMIAAGLDWELDEIEETIEPVVAQAEIRGEAVTVKPGQVAGVRQVGRGIKGGKALITLDFQAALGAKEPYDAVFITGTPNMEVVIKGGTPGDLATAAMVVNTIPRILAAPPGLLTMKDLPLVCALPGR
jgi:2,4-diaminopentanoate dehydrogenase